MKAYLLTFCLLVVCVSAGLIWPLPASESYDGESIPIAKSFKIEYDAESNVLVDSVKRYTSIIGTSDETDGFNLLTIKVDDLSDELSFKTDAKYKITIDGNSGILEASTSYGAMYGLESFSQLINNKTELLYNKVTIEDYPVYNHRGIMIDSGRRFIPVHTVKLLIDSMPYNKLNVLHWHLSDWARVAVESKVYPVLTKYLVDLQAGFYTQEEVVDIINYAKLHGVRIIPEFDIPGHSKGWSPLAEVGMEFCDDKKQQLYDDPNNKTYTILTTYLKEVLALFPEPYVHLGCDETTTVGKCTPQSFGAFETKIFNYVYNELGKRPMAWEEVLFSKQSATPFTIVNGWHYHPSKEILAKGYDTVESHGGNFYLNHLDYIMENMWTDLMNLLPTYRRGLRDTNDAVLFGGETSMWTDDYCYNYQCGLGSSLPQAHELYNPKYDHEFEMSMLGIMYPRIIASSGSFWRFNDDLKVGSTEYKTYYTNANLRLIARNIPTCPEECTCNYLSRCGEKYIKE